MYVCLSGRYLLLGRMRWEKSPNYETSQIYSESFGNNFFFIRANFDPFFDPDLGSRDEKRSKNRQK